MGSAADRVKSPARISVWHDRRTPSRLSRKSDHPAGLDRDRITVASVALLDAEGLAGFSMRRLAAKLDVTAMSLYWYVDTKDDLLELALDSVFDETAPPPQTGADWRDRLRELATGYRTMLVGHPWASELAGRFPNIGPHATRFSYAVRDVIRMTSLPPCDRTGAAAAVFRFVHGFGTIEGQAVQRALEAGSGGGDAVEQTYERDFAFALDLLIAGIEAMCAREDDERVRGGR